MITTNQLYMAALAGTGLAAVFLVLNLLIAAGRVLRGRDHPVDLPIRLTSVAVALASALIAWPHARTAILDTIGQDAGAIVATVNSLAEIDLPALDLSDNSLPNVNTDGQGMTDLFAPDIPSAWGGSAQTQSAASEAATVFEPLTIDGQPLAGEMSVNDPTLPPTFPDPTPTAVFQPLVVQGQAVTGQMSVNNPNLPPTFPDPTATPVIASAVYQGAPVTSQLHETVDSNDSWLKFHTDASGQVVTGAMSVPAPGTSMVEEAPASGNPFQTLQPGGGPSNPPVQPTAGQPVPVTTVYVVGPGDTMFKLAQAFYGDGKRWPDICAANQPRNCDLLVAGQRLTIP